MTRKLSIPKISAIVAAVALLVTGGMAAYNYGYRLPKLRAEEVRAAEAEEAKTEEVKEEQTEPEIPQYILDFTVDRALPLLDEVKDVSMVALDDSTPERAEERYEATGFLDAVSFPFEEYEEGKGATKYTDEEIESMVKAVKESILRNVPYGAMWVKDLAEIEVDADTKLADLNPWMEEFIEKYDELGNPEFETKHTKYFEKHGVEVPENSEDFEEWHKEHVDLPIPNPSMDLAFVTDDDGKPVVYVTDEYREVMNKVVFLVNLLADRTYISTGWKTSYHWYLTPLVTEWKEVKAIWNTDRDYYDDKPVLVLKSTLRKDGKAVMRGVNLVDRRIEHYEKIKAEPKKPDPQPIKKTVTVPVVQASGGGGGTPGTVTPPGETPPPNTPPDTPPDENTPCIPQDDPVNNGNADKGGGDNPPNASDPWTPKPDTLPDGDGHYKNPENVYPDTPAPAPGAPTDVVNTDENKMNYAPDNTNQSTIWTSDSTGQSAKYDGSNNSSSSSNDSSGDSAPVDTTYNQEMDSTPE